MYVLYIIYLIIYALNLPDKILLGGHKNLYISNQMTGSNVEIFHFCLSLYKID